MTKQDKKNILLNAAITVLVLGGLTCGLLAAGTDDYKVEAAKNGVDISKEKVASDKQIRNMAFAGMGSLLGATTLLVIKKRRNR